MKILNVVRPEGNDTLYATTVEVEEGILTVKQHEDIIAKYRWDAISGYVWQVGMEDPESEDDR